MPRIYRSICSSSAAAPTKQQPWRHRLVKPLLICLLLSWNSPLLLAQSTPSDIMINRPDNIELPTLGDAASEDLSPAAERRIGVQAMQQIRQDPDYIDDGLLNDYLNGFAYQLLSAARVSDIGLGASDFELFGVRDTNINAFAMPGGFIGVNTGLLVAAQTESELASVLAHECGHVLQRHLARQLGLQKQTSPIAIAALILALLAARSNPDAAIGGALTGQAAALQKQLNFSRDAEREADRVGFQLLRDAGYDVNGMPGFFTRLQNATRAYDSAAPVYLRTHPLTTERIADIQNRARSTRGKPYTDSPEFVLLKARARVLQTVSVQTQLDARNYFDNQLKRNNLSPNDELGVRYGIALLDLRDNRVAVAKAALPDLQNRLKQIAKRSSPVLEELGIEIAMQDNRANDAVKLAENARRQFPLSRALSLDYARALQKADRHAEAVAYLRDQVQLYRQEGALWDLLATSYDALHKRSLQMAASAESAMLKGQTLGAVQLLENARRVNDADFYDMSIIDSRYKEVQNKAREELAERGSNRRNIAENSHTLLEHNH